MSFPCAGSNEGLFGPLSIYKSCPARPGVQRCGLLKKYVIHGGKPLYGKIEISGAKNAAVGIIPATLLVQGGVPR